MPNWCENKLFVYGKKEDLTFFKNKAIGENYNGEKTVFSLHSLVPMPEVLIKNPDFYSKLRSGIEESEDTPAYIKTNCYITKHNAISSYIKNVDIDSIKDEELKSLIMQAKDYINKYGDMYWYEWALNNWGTKWDISYPVLDELDDELCYSFDSAWSPPIEGIKKVSIDFPNLHFILSYSEPGCDFMGVNYFNNGYMIEESSSFPPFPENLDPNEPDDYTEYEDSVFEILYMIRERFKKEYVYKKLKKESV